MAIHTQPLSLKLKNLQAIADEEYSAVNLVEESIHKFGVSKGLRIFAKMSEDYTLSKIKDKEEF